MPAAGKINTFWKGDQLEAMKINKFWKGDQLEAMKSPVIYIPDSVSLRLFISSYGYCNAAHTP